MEINPYTYIKHWWSNWPWKWPTLALFLIVIIAIVGLITQQRGNKPLPAEPEVATAVTVQPLNELVQSATIKKIGIIEAAVSAPLVARTGGRVTVLNARLGDTVNAGITIAEIDGGFEGNVAQGQIAGLSQSLAALNNIQLAAITASDAAIRIAELNRNAASSQQGLGNEQAALGRRLADNSVHQTALALQDARDGSTDDIIRAADLANKATQLVQDQATVTRQLAAIQGSLGAKQAQANLLTAQAGKRRTLAELANQRAQITTQLNVAREQLQLQQVTAPVNGQIARLTISEGDVLTPGQVIGEVVALGGAQIRLDVSTGVRNQLAAGNSVAITTAKQSFNGAIARLSDVPSSLTGLWQIDIFIVSTPEVINPGDSVTVTLPVGPATSDSYFIPLDAINVRQRGTVLFSVGPDSLAHEHIIDIVGFNGDYVEVRTDLPLATQIVLTGNRTLRDLDEVAIQSN